LTIVKKTKGTGRRERAAADHPPSCVTKAYEQYLKGAGLDGKLTVKLIFQEKTAGSVRTINYLKGDIDQTNRGMLRFLACSDAGGAAHADARKTWAALRRLVSGDADFESAGAGLAYWALLPPQLPARLLTREAAKALDLKIAKCARRLSAALKSHPNFSAESSAMNWPKEDASRLARTLSAFPADAAMYERAFPEGVEKNLHAFRRGPQLREDLLYLVTATSPTVAELLDTLSSRADSLAPLRAGQAKARRSTGEAHDTFYMRHLIAQMIRVFPDAGPHQIANLVAPIVTRALGVPSFERCKGAARTIIARGKSPSDNPDLYLDLYASKLTGQ
jgi:hypothetical protein